jgi:hypothetical protein
LRARLAPLVRFQNEARDFNIKDTVTITGIGDDVDSRGNELEFVTVRSDGPQVRRFRTAEERIHKFRLARTQYPLCSRKLLSRREMTRCAKSGNHQISTNNDVAQWVKCDYVCRQGVNQRLATKLTWDANAFNLKTSPKLAAPISRLLILDKLDQRAFDDLACRRHRHFGDRH